ncbi:MAG: hypothetical protein M9934_07160 [Thermomicrobiales bacterium]|nr:hypothetical protein [Thermomicrobiales bacterium]MCO5218686.1 hypothetical protein [Thermomicrobiales bacterium]MCO5228049.1 hypothetical protein [Thermomicrobiales bacterium]
MNEEIFQDLKQFIEATVSSTVTQSEQRMMERMDQRFEEMVDGMNLQTEIIIDHIDRTSAATNAKLNDHEERISRLERNAA